MIIAIPLEDGKLAPAFRPLRQLRAAADRCGQRRY